MSAAAEPMSKRDVLVYRAKLAEQAERYDEMSQIMKQVAQSTEGDERKPLTNEERNLLSVAYKNAVGARRASVRIITSIEQKQRKKGTPEQVKIAEEFLNKVEQELQSICLEVIDVIDKYLIHDDNAVDSNVFYYKMKGDYYRYLSEFNPEKNPKYIEATRKTYETAAEYAQKLPPTDAIRLGLNLNFSVFYFEILQDQEKACLMAQKAFDDAIAELDNVTEENYRDSTLIMQLLRDNLTLWTSDPAVHEER